MAKGRMSFTQSCVGVVRAALQAAVRHAAERKQFGTPVAGHQPLQKVIEETAVASAPPGCRGGRAPTTSAAGCLAPPSRGGSCTGSPTRASEAAVRCASNALQIFGGQGCNDTYPVGKAPAR
ncbi:acyl-CoA dehydrogenase family protein [Streptomyces sp. NPDC018833]|uniref:acyl-CoA dehydrogenase family protein n=1 Tax=Streptomyces sp. NPDC018833 TaxID=3365053 RepID=UPI00379598F5